MSVLSIIKRKRSVKIPPCAAVIAAAGSSGRMAGEDKLFMEIVGVPVLAYTLTAFQRCELIREIIVVSGESRIGDVSRLCEKFAIGKAVKIITGGGTRLESVLNGVFAVSRGMKLIAIHDGARPCISGDVIESTIAAAAKNNAAAPAIQISSTIKLVKDGIVLETVDRDGLYQIQTPQVFDADLIKAALTNAMKKGADVTDDCMAAENIGARIHITGGSLSNIKITTIDDFAVAEAILRGCFKQMRPPDKNC